MVYHFPYMPVLVENGILTDGDRLPGQLALQQISDSAEGTAIPNESTTSDIILAYLLQIPMDYLCRAIPALSNPQTQQFRF